MLEIIKRQREYFNTNETKKVSFRINSLRKLKQVIKLYEELILDALNKDLGKSRYEAFVTEVGLVYQEINYQIKKLPKWSKVNKVKTPKIFFGSKSFVKREPYGVVLIISPWNYPFQLSFLPLIGALAAGNTIILKPSTQSGNTSKVIVKMIKEYFKPEQIAVVEGDRDILDYEYDYIFFTGSVNVGKIIMEKASKYLTPVTLELGGKSPCIVYKDADISKAARAIIYGKLLNAGQTCVAPDYLLAHKDIKEELINAIINAVDKYYPKALDNDYYPKLINQKQFNRLNGYLEKNKIVYGGKTNLNQLKLEPTIVTDINNDDKVMNEEIFGPILPIIAFSDLSEVITYIKKKPKPLALYLFTTDKLVEKEIINQLDFGGACINDTLIHLSTPYLPFGGVGNSGMGRYHGYASFTTFTYQKSIFKKGNFDTSLRYPPYTDNKLKIIKRIFK